MSYLIMAPAVLDALEAKLAQGAIQRLAERRGEDGRQVEVPAGVEIFPLVAGDAVSGGLHARDDFVIRPGVHCGVQVDQHSEANTGNIDNFGINPPAREDLR